MDVEPVGMDEVEDEPHAEDVVVVGGGSGSVQAELVGLPACRHPQDLTDDGKRQRAGEVGHQVHWSSG